jgi:arginine decarboxylase
MDDATGFLAEDLYRIRYWGEGYFGVEDAGRLQVLPVIGNDTVRIAVQEVVDELKGQGVQFPLVLRFHDILKNRVRELNESFATAIADAEYGGVYRGVYPIKVNQMREVVDEIVDAGRPYHYGLEAGSKSELMAVLSYDVGSEALTVCNGYKDEEFLRLALLGNKLKRKVIVVIEKFSEIAPLLRLAAEMEVQPIIGLRIKMRVKTEGRWSGSSGERAKFGLTTSEILNAIELIQKEGYGDCIQLLHFHIGSQLTDIRYVEDAVQEAARIYARLRKRGIPLQFLDIGGGLGVDYDGSRSSGDSSMNYTLAEYAGSVVGNVKQICDLEEVDHPNLVSESGRAIVAHHSCVIMRVIGEIPSGGIGIATDPAEEEHFLVSDMRNLCEELAEYRNYREAYSRASRVMDGVLEGFKLGVVRLEELAKVETLYWKLMRGISAALKSEDYVSEDLRGIDDQLASQYLCNFSLFQSAAHSWAIGQILPVVPLVRLREPPTQQCTIADITCDSDGKIARFIGEYGEQTTLALHELRPDEEYYIGLFLTGAYQDVMGDMHNLFGRLNEAHVFCDDDDPTDFYIEEVIPGSSAGQVLTIMQYNVAGMAAAVKRMIDDEVRKGAIRAREGVRLTDFYESCLNGYT